MEGSLGGDGSGATLLPSCESPSDVRCGLLKRFPIPCANFSPVATFSFAQPKRKSITSRCVTRSRWWRWLPCRGVWSLEAELSWPSGPGLPPTFNFLQLSVLLLRLHFFFVSTCFFSAHIVIHVDDFLKFSPAGCSSCLHSGSDAAYDVCCHLDGGETLVFPLRCTHSCIMMAPITFKARFSTGHFQQACLPSFTIFSVSLWSSSRRRKCNRPSQCACV